MKLSVMKSLVLNAVIGTLASGALYADVSLSKNLGECPVGPISHDFSNDAAQKGIKINTGNCTRPGAFNWSGAVANYNGTVHPGDNASGGHAGRFEGKGEWIANGGAGGAGGKNEVDWSAELTGKGEKKFSVKCTCAHNSYTIEFKGIATSDPSAEITLILTNNGTEKKKVVTTGNKCNLTYIINGDTLLRPWLGRWLLSGEAKYSDGDVKKSHANPK